MCRHKDDSNKRCILVARPTDEILGINTGRLRAAKLYSQPSAGLELARNIEFVAPISANSRLAEILAAVGDVDQLNRHTTTSSPAHLAIGYLDRFVEREFRPLLCSRRGICARYSRALRRGICT